MKPLKILSLVATTAFATFLYASTAQAMPVAPTSTGVAESAGLINMAKWKQKHRSVKGKHWNRDNHYGWSRGRGHHYGWSRGRGPKYGLRRQGRY